MEVSSQLQTPAALPLRNGLPVTIRLEVEWAPDPVCTCGCKDMTLPVSARVPTRDCSYPIDIRYSVSDAIIILKGCVICEWKWI
jgi:hypothetical protein